MTRLGYEFVPGKRAVGYAMLRINLRETPTEEHYDPEDIRLGVTMLDGNVQQIAIHHPWHAVRDWHVAPGPIRLTDRKDKVVEGFSFGGRLQIQVHGDWTECAVTSSAPIFGVLSGFHTGMLDAVSVLVEEVEMLFARARAAWGRDDAGFQGRLASADPTLLYAASRVAVHSHLAAQPEQLRMTRYRSTLHLLHLLAVDDPIPTYAPALDELLGCSLTVHP